MNTKTFKRPTVGLLTALFSVLGVTGGLTLLLGDDDLPPWRRLQNDPPQADTLERQRAICLECHAEDTDVKPLPSGDKLVLKVVEGDIASSIHGGFLTCTDCHTRYRLDDDHEHVLTDADGRNAFRTEIEQACRACHADIDRGFARGGHHKAEHGPSCVSCHGGHHVKTAALAPENISAYCGACHEDAVRNLSGTAHDHDPGVTCLSCHGAHDTAAGTVPRSKEYACLQCHEDQTAGMAGSSHGTLETGCQACHGSHRISVTRSESKKEQGRLCAGCHETAHRVWAAGAHGSSTNGPACGACHDPHQALERKPAIVEKNCAACHGTDAETLARTAHGACAEVGCASCHGVHAPRTGRSGESPGKACASCHLKVAERHRSSAHAEKTGCTDCHGTHVLTMTGADRKSVNAGCGRCHETAMQQLGRGDHGKGSGPSCTGCHGSHTARAGRNGKEITAQCARCHPGQATEHGQGGHAGRTGAPGCRECHGVHEVRGDPPPGGGCTACHQGVASKIEKSAHRALGAASCSKCHGAHAVKCGMVADRKKVTPFCLSCHEELSDYASKNHHERALQRGDVQAPHCIDCHGGHDMPDVESGVTGGWAEKWLATRCRDCHEKRGAVAERHQWLFQAEFHFRGQLACHGCHLGALPECPGHILSSDIAPVHECEACHGPDSILSKRGCPEEGREDLFTEPLAAGRYGYVMGATRFWWLDILGALMVLGTFAGMVFGHGGLRVLSGWWAKRNSPGGASP